jgi:protein TonB
MASERNLFFSRSSGLFADPHEKRLGGALGASAVVHVLAAALAIFISQLPRSQVVFRIQPVENPRMIFLPLEGPGGGGGGGGNKIEAPPPKLELPKQAKPPTLKPPPKVQPPKPEPPKPEPQMNIPLQTIAPALATVPGAVEAPPVATEARGSGSGPGAGTGSGSGSGPGSGSGLGPGSTAGFGGGVYRPGSGIELPRVIFEKKPQYTADAMRAKVQGIVELEAVVLTDGSVGDVRVTRSLDRTFGLDHQAITAVKQWRFIPGMRLGQPVPVLVTVELTFTLR